MTTPVLSANLEIKQTVTQLVNSVWDASHIDAGMDSEITWDKAYGIFQEARTKLESDIADLITTLGALHTLCKDSRKLEHHPDVYAAQVLLKRVTKTTE